MRASYVTQFDDVLPTYWSGMRALMTFDNRHAVIDAWAAMYGAHSIWVTVNLQDTAVNSGIVYG